MNLVSLNTATLFPSKVVCIGRNYVEHIKELNNELPSEPVIFVKPNSAISSSLTIHNEDEVHYEAEISFLIKDGKLSAVAFGLDLTKRKIQSSLKSKGLPWERAKAFDKSAVFSDFVPLSGAVDNLRLELSINGKLTQQGGVDLMIYKPNQIIEEISEFMTLCNNDILMTGTPKGVGALKLGDDFTGEIYDGNELLLTTCWKVEH